MTFTGFRDRRSSAGYPGPLQFHAHEGPSYPADNRAGFYIGSCLAARHFSSWIGRASSSSIQEQALKRKTFGFMKGENQSGLANSESRGPATETIPGSPETIVRRRTSQDRAPRLKKPMYPIDVARSRTTSWFALAN